MSRRGGGLDSVRDDVLDEHLAVRGGAPGFLFPAFDEVEQQPERHQPHLKLCEVQVGKADIEQSGEDDLVAAGRAYGFGVSETTSRLVPRYSASAMASR